ncbi:S8 family serine peptidase, partial [Kytococcus sp. HMSC28H12]
TSSASPIVTGAVALVSSIAQEKGVELDPAAMRTLLMETGTPQAGNDSAHIGPLPNVVKAVEGLGSGSAE